jgi:hypothetical protein
LTVTKLKFVPFCHSCLIWTDASELQALTMTVLSVHESSGAGGIDFFGLPPGTRVSLFVEFETTARRSQGAWVNGAPEEIRTPNLLIRSQKHMIGWLAS